MTTKIEASIKQALLNGSDYQSANGWLIRINASDCVEIWPPKGAGLETSLSYLDTAIKDFCKKADVYSPSVNQTQGKPSKVTDGDLGKDTSTKDTKKLDAPEKSPRPKPKGPFTSTGLGSDSSSKPGFSEPSINKRPKGENWGLGDPELGEDSSGRSVSWGDKKVKIKEDGRTGKRVTAGFSEDFPFDAIVEDPHFDEYEVQRLLVIAKGPATSSAMDHYIEAVASLSDDISWKNDLNYFLDSMTKGAYNNEFKYYSKGQVSQVSELFSLTRQALMYNVLGEDENLSEEDSRTGNKITDTFANGPDPSEIYRNLKATRPSKELLEDIMDPDKWVANRVFAQMKDNKPNRGPGMPGKGKGTFAEGDAGGQLGAGCEAEKEAVAPPGWENTVKKMKKHPEIDNPYALTNYMENKGMTPGGKDKKESKKVAQEDDYDLLRDVDVDGYRLRMWDAGEKWDGRQRRNYVRYEFSDPSGKVIFSGDDYGTSPMQAIDSDESVRGLLRFLTLKPGDTDDEYFEEYTPEQKEFAENAAEELSLWGMEPQEDDEDDFYHNFKDWGGNGHEASHKQAGPKLREKWLGDGGYHREIESESAEELHALVRGFSGEEVDWSPFKPSTPDKDAQDTSGVEPQAQAPSQQNLTASNESPEGDVEAVDEKAKETITDYFGEYGKELTKGDGVDKKKPKKAQADIQHGEFVDFEITDSALILRPTEEGRERAQELLDSGVGEIQGIPEMLEDLVSNGWEFINPEEIGALTEGEIISNDVSRDEDGEIVDVGIVYWNSDYAITNTLGKWAEGEPVKWSKQGKKKAQAEVGIYWDESSDPSNPGWVWESDSEGKPQRPIPGYEGQDPDTDDEELEDIARTDPFFPKGDVTVTVRRAQADATPPATPAPSTGTPSVQQNPQQPGGTKPPVPADQKKGPVTQQTPMQPGVGDAGIQALGWTQQDVQAMTDEQKQKILQVQLSKPGTQPKTPAPGAQKPTQPTQPAKPTQQTQTTQAPVQAPGSESTPPAPSTPAPKATKGAKKSTKKRSQAAPVAPPEPEEGAPATPQPAPATPPQKAPSTPGGANPTTKPSADSANSAEQQAFQILQEVQKQPVEASSANEIATAKTSILIKRLSTEIGMGANEAAKLFGLPRGNLTSLFK